MITATGMINLLATEFIFNSPLRAIAQNGEYISLSSSPLTYCNCGPSALRARVSVWERSIVLPLVADTSPWCNNFKIFLESG